MEVTRKPKPRSERKGSAKLKYHNPNNINEPEIAEIKQKYETVEYSPSHTPLAVVSDEDVEKMLEKYATTDLDLFTVAEAFNCCRDAMYKIINSEKWKEKFKAAKQQKSFIFAKSALDVAKKPFQDFINGDREITPAFVNAAKVYSNHLKWFACSLNEELNTDRWSPNESAGQQINVQVNTAVQLKI